MVYSLDPAANLLKQVLHSFVTVTKFLLSLVEAAGVKFAPLNVPLERRLQTLAALGWILLMMFGEMASIGLIVLIMRTDYYWLALAYVMVIASQRFSSGLGKRSWSWVRQWRWWKYLNAYFPCTLVKTVDLDPKKNYLFCIFPHGVLSTASFTSLATDACGFEDIFPGMKAHLLTLDGHFLVPFFRELVVWLGVASASAESINYLLDTSNGTGRCAGLVVGGAAESLNCHAGYYKIIVKRRKGFVKMALKHGAPLVPVFCFGETELYKLASNPEGSTLRKWQDWFRQKTGVAPVVGVGRGILQYSFGIIPRRKPLTTVVGKPIEIKRNADPTPEEIDAVHSEYIESLTKLFEENKSKYIPHFPEAKLIIE